MPAPGNDVLWGDVGADFHLGEDGDDTYHVDDANDRVIEAFGGGFDTVASTVTYTLARHVEQLILQGEDAINGTGNELDNVLIGNNAANILDGGFGKDQIEGGVGDDTYIVRDLNDRSVNMKGTERSSRSLVMVLVVLLIAGCATGLSARDETPGQHFDRMMKEFAANCATAKLKPNDTACDILKLKPADPLASEEGRFAHSIKIPNPVTEDSGYKPGMTPEQYFDHLCKTEAGEFIYKTVENVEGLYMMRPRKEATDYELEHLYALEDPYGYITEGKDSKARDLFVRHGWYGFIESAAGDLEKREIQYTPQYIVGKRKTLTEESVPSRKSRFGYTWRGISRPHDRELGIAGGELIVLDLSVNEVIAIRRGYIRSGGVRNNMTGIWWLSGQGCPKGENGRTDFYTYDFIRTVLKPR